MILFDHVVTKALIKPYRPMVLCEAGQGDPAFALTLSLLMQPFHHGSTKLPSLILRENDQQMNMLGILIWLAA